MRTDLKTIFISALGKADLLICFQVAESFLLKKKV